MRDEFDIPEIVLGTAAVVGIVVVAVLCLWVLSQIAHAVFGY